MCLLSLAFIRFFYYAFRPSALYQTHTKVVNGLLNNCHKMWSPEEGLIRIPLGEMNPQQLQTWTNNVQWLVMVNRFCYFFSSKLKDYQKSNITVGFDILNLFILTLVTVLFFGVINYGLYKSAAGSFTPTVPPTFFIFCYYSTANLFGRSINEVVPASDVTRFFPSLKCFFLFP